MPVVRLAELIGQPEVVPYLRGIVASGRFANAYLFHGPPGIGKGTAALAFAHAVLCERRGGAAAAEPGLFADAAPAGPADDACGACAGCHKVAALQHPDLKFLFPVSGEERTLDETIGETLEEFRTDPLFTFVYEQAAAIRLSMTRDLIQELAYKPYEAAWRVVVVRDADRMREDQYSAMLKSIEEPGSSTVWVLTTSRPTRLPATIRSRCQRVRFRPLTEKAVADFLIDRANVPAVSARTFAALASGSVTRALAMRDSDPIVARNDALELLDIARGDSRGLWKPVQEFLNRGPRGREKVRALIEFHLLWLRDLLRAKYDPRPDMLVNRDRERELREQAETLDAREIRRRLMVLEETLRAIEGNVSPELALFSGLARVAGARLGESGWPPHVAARWEY